MESGNGLIVGHQILFNIDLSGSIDIEIIKNIKAMQARSDKVRNLGKRIVLVPTMGFLHEGHLSLMREGMKHGDDLIVSIFVNPTQFGPGEDFKSYPRDPDRDLTLTRDQGVHAVFMPDADDLYDDGFQSYVQLEHLPNHLCGKSRPVHFRGVATVVSKLFNIVKPHVAIFGQKDFQQLAVIRRMTKDLNFDIEIIGAPTLREPDGLAMSSRNTYLTKGQSQAALSLYNCLIKAVERVKNGEKDPALIIESSSKLITLYSENSIDYIAISDPETLEDVDTIEKPVLMAIAVKVGNTRLIDNMILTP